MDSPTSLTTENIKIHEEEEEQQQQQKEIHEEEEEMDLSGKQSSPEWEEEKSIKESTEKQISIDPISMKQKQPAKLKFTSSSFPSSANTSPRSPTITSIRNLLHSMKWRNQNQNPTSPIPCEIQLHRSKSCGDRRTCRPSIEVELWRREKELKAHIIKNNKGDSIDFDDDYERVVCRKNQDPCDEGFKCGAMCLFLPGFSKGKQVKAKKVYGDGENAVVSRVVSLEKFECGSWSSCGLNDEDQGMNLYFDLPLELIKSSFNEVNSPITTAFVFDRERVGAPHGVLKKSPSISKVSRKSHESSSRHVRFSISQPSSLPSSPTCITPRLRQARDQFNAYLAAAQNA